MAVTAAARVLAGALDGVTGITLAAHIDAGGAIALHKFEAASDALALRS
mgnify:CR=1 FL=1